MQLEPQTPVALSGVDSISADHVFEFLSSNPGFFDQHPELLGRLCIPHDCGPAISLIERQVGALRQRSQSLESRLRELIAVARENEALHRRVHELVQDVISADSVEQVLNLARHHLLEGFRADRVNVVLIEQDDDQAALFEPGEDPLPLAGQEPWCRVSSADSRLAHWSAVFANGRTVCGDLGSAQLKSLYGPGVFAGSCAVIPLTRNRRVGLVVLTSNDPHRFESSKGVMFLDQLGSVLGRRLHTLDRIEAMDA